MKALPRTLHSRASVPAVCFATWRSSLISYRSNVSSRINGAVCSFSSYKIAIVGSGPAGCYSAKYLKSSLIKQQQHHSAQIDVIERLPTPFGLLRYGVAPDHPEVKNVQNDFGALFEDSVDNSQDEDVSVRFFGNVQVGRDVTLSELRSMYDAVLLAYGCESEQQLILPGSHLPQILSARQFVAWYNGHPDFVHIGEQVANALRVSQKNNDTMDTVRNAHVVVIGQGNVALDCARIMSKGSPHLYDTDIASHTFPVIGGGVSNLSVIGRRGPIQAAFTMKELRELVRLQKEGYGTSFHVSLDEIQMGLNGASIQEMDGLGGRPKKRICDLLLKAAAATATLSVESEKRIDLRFLLNPVRFEARPDDPNRLGAVVCEKTTLTGESGNQNAIGTGNFEIIAADLVLISIGYRGTALPGIEQFFDERIGVVRSCNGKVDNSNELEGGLYVAGWLKRGPTGIIGTNIPDAKDTVSTMLLDLQDSKPRRVAKRDIDSLLKERNVRYISWKDYQRLDQFEQTHKRSEKQPREKIVSIEIQLEVALK